MKLPVTKKELKRMGIVALGVPPLALIFDELARVLPEAIWWPLTVIVAFALLTRAMFWIEAP